jgi:hypothetical protein
LWRSWRFFDRFIFFEKCSYIPKIGSLKISRTGGWVSIYPGVITVWYHSLILRTAEQWDKTTNTGLDIEWYT